MSDLDVFGRKSGETALRLVHLEISEIGLEAYKLANILREDSYYVYKDSRLFNFIPVWYNTLIDSTSL